MNKAVFDGIVNTLVTKLYATMESNEDEMSYEDFKLAEEFKELMCGLSTMNDEIEFLKRRNFKKKEVVNSEKVEEKLVK